jgi:predicted AAA+ superfamily ATPase
LSKSDDFFSRAEKLVERLEALVPEAQTIELTDAFAWRWRKSKKGLSRLEAIESLSTVNLSDLLHVSYQKERLVQNTRQFMSGLPANNVLLWGPKGTGKSSLVKALLNNFLDRGLRLIEVDRHDLIDLPEIVDIIKNLTQHFIIYCDDLSFDGNDETYRALKSILDGSVLVTPKNILVYATSNRRHLLPEHQEDNQKAKVINGELHQDEAVEEKISLSERFGIWLSFHPIDQQRYLDIVNHWLYKLGASAIEVDRAKDEALRWALSRGSRSGRSANQFARDWVGRSELTEKT